MEDPYISHPWRLLLDPPSEGVQNMAIDEALLESCAEEQGEGPFPTLRFYRWSRPTASLGYHQDLQEALHLRFCGEKGIPVVRRPTGGKAVLHDDELTYSLIAHLRFPPFQSSALENYRMISEALIEGLKILGMKATIAETDRPVYDRHGSQACFARLSRYEISLEGLKLIGSAQKRKKKAFLQHGSLLRDAHRGLIKNVVKLGPFQEEMGFITVKEALGRAPSFEEMTESLMMGFQKKFGISFEKSILSEKERKMAEMIARKRKFLVQRELISRPD